MNNKTMARTSASHPLQIAAVPVGKTMGRVGITLCPGKKQPFAMTGAWDRCLDTDVAAISNWGEAALVTLVEAHELASLGVSELGEVADRERLDWCTCRSQMAVCPTRGTRRGGGCGGQDYAIACAAGLTCWCTARAAKVAPAPSRRGC